MFAIVQEAIEPGKLSQTLVNESAGALSTFEGWVRNRNDGRDVKGLEYECFATLAEKEGEKILAEAKANYSVVDIVCQHRVGTLKVGELAVWVGATAVHRGEAFSACRYVIDQVKLRVPVWKKEHYVDGSSTWVNCSAHEHERSQHKPSQLSESAYYSRQTLMQEVGERGQQKLKDSSVLVIGAGGTGCPALQYLAGAGIGKIGICDFDIVDPSNLHRQPLFTAADIGLKKAEIAAERLRLNNPFVVVQSIAQKFDSANAARIIKDYDVILDCTDNLEAKFNIADACMENSKVFLQGSIHGFNGEILLWRPRSGSEKSRAQQDYEGQCYRCLWPSRDALQDNGKDCITNCTESGVIGAVPGIVGTLQASETIKCLLGISSPLTSHVLLLDLLTLSTSRIKARRNADCPICGDEIQRREYQPDSKEQKEQREQKEQKEHAGQGSRVRTEQQQEDQDVEEENDFELHWSVLRSRSPRELVYVDIRTHEEIESDPATRDKLKGRQLHEWPLDSIDVQTLKLDKTLTYLFVCQRGKRSASLVRKLRQLGHRNVFSLSEGVNSMAPQHSERAKV